METLYKKLHSVTVQIRPYKDEQPNMSEESLSPSERLLLDSKDDIDIDSDTTLQKRSRRGFLFAIAVHSLIFAIYTVGLYVTSSFLPPSGQKAGPPMLVYTPAHGALKYEKFFYNGSLGSSSRFKGEPNPEIDQAWHDLVRNNNLRLSKDELEKLNRTALELADGGGYFGQLNVYHHLHCLKFIREAFYSEYYPVAQGPTTQMHVDHCIDDIRHALMCHADTAMTTFNWEEGIRRPMPDFTGWHTCNNWEELEDWATQRAFSMFDQKTLVNPTYGIAFPMINGSIEYTPPGPGMHIVWPEDH